MESYLKGRPKTQKFTANLSAPKNASALNANEDAEKVVRAQAAPDVVDAPDVDLVVRDGVVRKIIIHMPDGNIMELECDYGDEEPQS